MVHATSIQACPVLVVTLYAGNDFQALQLAVVLVFNQEIGWLFVVWWQGLSLADNEAN
jgi:hypothetical protein